MENEKVKKILVIRFSSLGDVLLTTPLLRKIKQKYPSSELHYCVKNKFSEVLANNPNIHKLITVADDIDFKGLKALKQSIKADGYDIIIDAHNNLRSLYLRLFMPGRKFVFNKHSIKKFLLVKFKINLMRSLPSIINRYISILGISDIKGELPEIFTSDTAKQNIDNLLKSLNLPAGKKLICIAPSSAHFTKTYPAEYYISLISKFDKDKYTFLLTGTGNDNSNIDIITASTGENVYDLCDKLTISGLAELIKRCHLFISGDTGPMHIAEAVGTNLIMLAGSSVKEFGFYPQNDNSVVLERDGLKCRPCSHIGRNECPLGHFKCMKEITSDEVLLSAKKFLEQ